MQNHVWIKMGAGILLVAVGWSLSIAGTPRPRLALLSFEVSGYTSSEAQELYDRVHSALVRSGMYDIVQARNAPDLVMFGKVYKCPRPVLAAEVEAFGPMAAYRLTLMVQDAYSSVLVFSYTETVLRKDLVDAALTMVGLFIQPSSKENQERLSHLSNVCQQYRARMTKRASRSMTPHQVSRIQLGVEYVVFSDSVWNDLYGFDVFRAQTPVVTQYPVAYVFAAHMGGYPYLDLYIRIRYTNIERVANSLRVYSGQIGSRVKLLIPTFVPEVTWMPYVGTGVGFFYVQQERVWHSVGYEVLGGIVLIWSKRGGPYVQRTISSALWSENAEAGLYGRGWTFGLSFWF